MAQINIQPTGVGMNTSISRCRFSFMLFPLIRPTGLRVCGPDRITRWLEPIRTMKAKQQPSP